MLSIKQMQICTGLNSLRPYNNESKSSRNLCYRKFSFIVLVPSAWSLVGDGLIDDAGSSLLLGFSPSLRERSEESRRLKLLVGGS